MTKVLVGGLISASLVVLGTAFACADDNPPAGASTPAAKPYPEGFNCVWRPTLREGYYTYIDDEHLVIEGTGKKYYLLTLSRRCIDLDTGVGLRFTAGGNQLCGPGDSVITRSDRCSIEYLETVSSTKEARSIVEDRDAAEKAARDAKKNNQN